MGLPAKPEHDAERDRARCRRRGVSAERDARIGQREDRHDDQPHPRQQRVFKALEGCLDFLARILECHHGNLPRLASQNVLFAIVGILHLIEKAASARDELFHVDSRLRRHRQCQEDAGDRSVNPGEKHRYPHAELRAMHTGGDVASRGYSR